MAAERFYIYRCGKSDSCAVTALKNDARLLRSLCPTNWQFWMQIGPLQSEHRAYGFNIWAAVREISTNGYHLFTGSPALLCKGPVARSAKAPAGRLGAAGEDG